MSTDELVRNAIVAGLGYGTLLGVLLTLVVRECVLDFKFWLRSLEHSRQIRCMKDWKETA